MKLNTMKRIAYIAAVTVAFANVSMVAHAENVSSVLPSAGINYTLDSNATSLSSMQESAQQSAPAKEEASGGINSLTASVKDSIPTDFIGWFRNTGQWSDNKENRRYCYRFQRVLC